MSNVINIGWEPLQLMMRDINSSNVPEEFKHLPFTDEVNQLLLSALSSGENNYYGNDSTYYRSRYGSSDQNSPCPPSNMYSNNSTSLSPPQPGQLSPPQQQAKAPKIQPPSIQLPNSQHPNAQLSPRLLHQNQLLPQLQPQLQNIPQNKISQPQQTQMQQRYQQQVPTKNQPQQQQMQMPQLPPQLQQMQQMQQQQQQQQNTISSLDPPRATALQAHLLQQLQQQRQAQQQNSQQVKQQPSPPQQSRPSSPTQVSLQRPPSPPDMVQQPQQQQQRMSPTRQLLPAHLINQQLPTGYSSHLPVLPQFQSQMLPSHLNNPMLNQSHLMNMQQLQQYQLQATQQIPVPSSSLQPAQSSQSQPQQQPQQQQSPQLQTTQQTMKPTTTAPAPSQAPAQQSQFMRTVSQPPSSSSSPSSIPMEPLSPTVYQFINVKDEQQDNKSKPLTEKQKNRRRASQNLASRNYRQRKKEYITTMEDRAQDLEHQNELLRRQMNQKEVIISKLSKENSTLRANANLNEEKYSHDVDIEDAYSPIDSNMQDLILKLERTLKLEKVDTDDEAESAGLKSTLQAFYGSLHERHDRYTNQVKEIVNPCTQAKLSALYADPTSPFDNGFTENDDDWWEAFSEDADIADEQADKIQEIRRGHHIEFQRLRTERRDLNKDIRDYYKMVFSSAIGGKEELEADVKMEELVDKLNFLKENLENEKHLILKTHEAMSKILTPKQEAMLVTRSYNKVVRSNATIQMVTNMYEVVLKENALAKCCAPGWEVL